MDVLAVAERDDDDQQYVIDGVNDPVRANTHSVSWPALEWTCRWGRESGASSAMAPWIRILTVDPPKCLEGCGPQLDLVRRHGQPRSAFTS